MKAVLLAATLTATLAAQPGRIQGTVVDQTTGKPLERVHVSLLPVRGDGSGSDVYGAVSGSAGRFSVTGVTPGRYAVQAERTGFVQRAEIRVVVKEDRETADLTVKMTRPSMIVGRVVDQYGDPVMRVPVGLEPIPPTKLSPSLVLGVYTQTDDRGEFRILTGPGKYYVKAEAHQEGHGRPPEVRTDGTSDPIYTTTYYPNSTSPERAAAVEAAPGRDVEGLEIHLAVLGPQRTFTVSGSVKPMPDDGMVRLDIVPLTDIPTMPSVPRPQDDGKFSVSGLLPGEYQLDAIANRPKKPLGARVKFTLQSDLAGLEVELHEAGELSGTLEMADRPSVSKAVKLEAVGFALYDSNHASATVGADGTFHFSGVWPGKFRVSVDPLPETAYIKSVELDGESVAHGEIEIDGGHVPRLKIAVALDGAVVSGKVVDKDGDPADDGLFVYILSGPREINRSMFVKDGKYSFHGIRPGTYRLAIRPADETFDSAKAYASGEEFELHPGDRIEKDLKVAYANQ